MDLFRTFLSTSKTLSAKGRKKLPEKKLYSIYTALKFGVDLYYRKTGSDFKLSSYEKFNLSQSYTNTQFNGFQSNIKGLNAYWISTTSDFPILQPIASRPTSGKAAVPCWPDSPIPSITFPSTIHNCPKKCNSSSAPP